MTFLTPVVIFLLQLALVWAETHTFYWNVTTLRTSPDGVKEKDVVTINATWPPPAIHVNQGDRIELYLTNGLKDFNTSIHFHGLFQRDNNQMDGAEMINQCPIIPGQTLLYNFTVDNQVGTYWYHSHTGNQYLDGFRGPVVIHGSEPFEYDEEVVLTVSDWYHANHEELIRSFMTKYNPTGAEPVPQNSLFNDTRNATWEVRPNTTYLLRIANVAGFVSQYLYIEDHEMTVVEVDGVYVEPTTTNMIYLTAAQRYSVLVKTKELDPKRNFCFMQVFDEDMLDVVPNDLVLASTNWLVYNKDAPLPEGYYLDELEPLDDYHLVPVQRQPLYPSYDYQIVLNVEMLNLKDGVNYALFNNLSYTYPKVPTLATVLSSPKDQVHNNLIYGTNTHNFILQKDEIVEIVLNNHDDGKHPFHLHGHNFQIIQRSPAFEDEPVDYDEENHDPFPDYPLIRDTIQVQSNGHMVFRFKANNPGVWFFHCHVDWHLEQGLAITLIEDPDAIRDTPSQHFSESHRNNCKAANIQIEGNAAGNTRDFTDLTGEKTQPGFLPDGFTPKGYFALFVTSLSAFVGLYSIYSFGSDSTNYDEQHIIDNLKKILVQNNAFDNILDGYDSLGTSASLSDDQTDTDALLSS